VVELRTTRLLPTDDLLAVTKYLPQLPDEKAMRYPFVAIDRATHWVKEWHGKRPELFRNGYITSRS
jgi:hypothetical protein